MKNEIMLTKDEIKRLIIQGEKLDRLEANGVDNWDGYSFCCEYDEYDEYDEWEDIDDYEERINKSELIIRD